MVMKSGERHVGRPLALLVGRDAEKLTCLSPVYFLGQFSHVAMVRI